MSASLGRITARLAEPTEAPAAGLVDLINSNINPPTPVTEDDVHIRAMYVVSDEVNSFGGRFPVGEHEHMAELLIDSPVMVGHRKDKLPIGRNFHATIVDRGGQSWVKNYFYWLRSAEGADSLLENIDGGIYKECSIGFTFLFPECSVCMKDIRTCEHEPFGEYDVDGKKVVCHFNYRQIERVLETSLVYRGAVPDTSVSKELRIGCNKTSKAGSSETDEPVFIKDLSRLDSDQKYLMMPFYEGIPVTATCSNGTLILRRLGGEPIDAGICSRFGGDGFPEKQLGNGQKLAAQLVAYRGKERLDVQSLERHLAGLSGPVSRLELKLIPLEGLDLSGLRDGNSPDKVRVIRHVIVDAGDIEPAARSLMTRKGVRLWPLDSLPPASKGYRYRPTDRVSDHTDCYFLSYTGGNGSEAVTFSFHHNNELHSFLIRQFSLARLMKGGRFIANKTDAVQIRSGDNADNDHRGRVMSLSHEEEGYAFNLTGALNGRFILRAVQLDGRRLSVFYRI